MFGYTKYLLGRIKKYEELEGRIRDIENTPVNISLPIENEKGELGWMLFSKSYGTGIIYPDSGPHFYSKEYNPNTAHLGYFYRATKKVPIEEVLKILSGDKLRVIMTPAAPEQTKLIKVK